MENEPLEIPEKITYETLWKSIIRPPRDIYEMEDLREPIFAVNGKTYVRKDFELLDFRGYLLKVSLIEPDMKERPSPKMPCVIYLHANASSRLEGLHIRKFLLRRNINLCIFDFEGSGLSEGEYISLGYHEKKQIKNIVDFIEKYPGVSEIGLWGRSMGAVTTLNFCAIDKRIKAICVDSPFSDFRKLAKEIVQKNIKIPGFLIDGAISIIGHSIYKKNEMNVNDIKTIENVKNCLVPVIFIHADDDEMVDYNHSLILIEHYGGKIKELKTVQGGHNGKRPYKLMEYVGDFFEKYLGSVVNKEDQTMVKYFKVLTKEVNQNVNVEKKENSEEKKEENNESNEENKTTNK